MRDATLSVPGRAEHPDTTCVDCNSNLRWAMLVDHTVCYVDADERELCPASTDETGDRFAHASMGYPNDGVRWQDEVDAYLDARDSDSTPSDSARGVA